jgi:hypothetical protein
VKTAYNEAPHVIISRFLYRRAGFITFFGAEDKHVRSYTSISPYVFMA